MMCAENLSLMGLEEGHKPLYAHCLGGVFPVERRTRQCRKWAEFDLPYDHRRCFKRNNKRTEIFSRYVGREIIIISKRKTNEPASESDGRKCRRPLCRLSILPVIDNRM